MVDSARHGAMKAYRIESSTLLGISLLVTALRSYYRGKTVGIKQFQADDYFVVISSVFQILETCLAYASVTVGHGLANNSMTDEYRARLSPGSEEYRLRTVGSKIQVAGWLVYLSALWSLKVAMCTFYLRLVSGLWKYRRRIIAGFVLIGTGWVVVILNVFLCCRPLNHMWQINPNPGNSCQAVISYPILLVSYVFNVSTDFYLIYIPLPILLRSTMRTRAKVGLSFLFCCAIFIVIAATLRVAALLAYPERGGVLAGPWAVRETFVAVVVTNLPVIFPLFKQWAGFFYRSSRDRISRSSRRLKWPYGSQKGLRESRLSNPTNSRKSHGFRLSTATTVVGGLERDRKMSQFNEMADPWSTTARGITGSASEHRILALGREPQMDDEEAALNRHQSQVSEDVIETVPPCQIRKKVKVSVKGSDNPPSTLGNFTSAWGPIEGRYGPDRPVNMRTPYLPDYLKKGRHGGGQLDETGTSQFSGS